MSNQKNSSSKERVIGFFNNEVCNYILKDIYRLTVEIRPDKNTGFRGCTVPLAMMLFAVIDLFGYLTRDDENPKKNDTLGNYRYLLSEKAEIFPRIYFNNCERIVKLFRHGLVHQFFPKAAGISKAGLEIPLIFEMEGIPILNVDVLSKDVQEAIKKIRYSIVENKDDKLIARINCRLDKLAKDDYEKLNSI